MSQEVDVLIIGSGACGAAAAWRLSLGTSLRIVCLEQGEATPAEHYPSHTASWELSRLGDFSPNPNVRQRPGDYPVDDSGSPISLANFNGFGGSTILYSGHFPRFHPSDFKVRSLDGVADDWPLSYEQLLPYFSENERQMGVAGLVGDPAYPDYESLLPPVPLGEMGRALARGFNQLGWHWWPAYSAINTRRHLNRAPCVNLGPCNTGCAQGAKSSVDVTYWPQALRQGVELRTGCRVVEICLDPSGAADGALYLDAKGAMHRLRARVVVVAASGLGTPRLLLNSVSTAFPDGLLNEQGLVGTHLMLHPLAYVEGVFEQDLRSSIGPHGCCLLSQQFYETDAQRGFVRGYTLQALRGAPPVETAVNGYFMRRIPLGPDHHREFMRTYNHTAGLAVITEDLPEAHNRILLDPEHRDSSGMPGVKVHYTLSDNTRRMLKHGVEASKQLLTAAGAKISASFAPVRHAGWHIMGTARMGHDAATSVVNPRGQAHAVKNLYIVDSSIFVTSAAVNPVATSQALTLYLCDQIKRQLQAQGACAC